MPPQQQQQLPLPAATVAQVRALGEAEAHLGSALGIVLGTLQRVRGVLAGARAWSGEWEGLGEVERQQQLSLAMYPWVEPLAGIPRLLQRVLEASGRKAEGRQVLAKFLFHATAAVHPLSTATATTSTTSSSAASAI